MECHSCSHTLIEKARFCDDCGVSTARVDLDEQALLTYCSKCAATLRGSRKYCIHCGEPSPHSGKFNKKNEQSWLLHVLMDARVQMAIVGSLLIVAALPAVSPVRYRFTSSIPFVEAYMEVEEPEQMTRQRDHENFRIRPIVDPETGAVKSPGGVARDSRGNLYVSDVEENVIYKIDPAGQQTLFAGTGEPGYAGDGAAAIRASLNKPRGLAMDDLDGLLIADSGNNVIRRVSAGGYISTIAGSQSAALDEPAKVSRLLDASQAQLMTPASVSTDIDGTLYVTESPCEVGPRDPTVWVLNPRS